MTRIRFEKQIDMIDGFKYFRYRNDVATVLSNQISKSPQSGIIGHGVRTKRLAHPVTANL